MTGSITLAAAGGGNEVGGSHYPAVFDGVPCAFDCGFRPQPANTPIRSLKLKNKELQDYIDSRIRSRVVKDQVPNIDFLSRIKHLFLTHGHLDHVGAVALLAKKHRYLTIYATPVTKKLMELHGFETIKIAERNKETPVFSAKDVEHALSRVVEIHPDQMIRINDKLSVKAIPAGHLVGAVSYLVYINGKPVGFHSGDISCRSRHRTVQNAPELYFDRLEYMVIDSTRLTEELEDPLKTEERLKQTIKKAYDDGLSIRFFVFSIGRAQEAFLLAREACPKAEIWIDGQAQKVTEIFSAHLNGMFSGVAKHFVNSRGQRERIARADEQNMVIVPSAMQFGGHAKQYAKHSIWRPDHMCISMGYIDPCSPEYAFFESEIGDVFSVERPMIRRCQVARFNWTGHCDKEDILAMRERLGAERAYLVHADNDRLDHFLAEHPGEGYVKLENGLSVTI